MSQQSFRIRHLGLTPSLAVLALLFDSLVNNVGAENLGNGLRGKILDVGADCNVYNVSVAFEIENLNSEPIELSALETQISGNRGTKFSAVGGLRSCFRTGFKFPDREFGECDDWTRVDANTKQYLNVSLQPHWQSRASKDTLLFFSADFVFRMVEPLTDGVPGSEPHYRKLIAMRIAFPPHPIQRSDNCK